MPDHHAQFLIVENQSKLSENKKENQLYCDFQEIEKKNTTSVQLENLNWEAELLLERSSINSSSELLINKVNRLNNFWVPVQKIYNKRKKTLCKS